jgi:putative transposase
VANRYPLPRKDDLLDKIQGATVFSTLDLLSAYHQIHLTDEDIPKTAFRTPTGIYEYKVMPFGFTNAPSVFMAAMNDILSEMGFAAVYLDDILIFSRTPEEHAKLVQLKTVRTRILKLSKCEFFKSSVPYHGSCHIFCRYKT